MEWRERIIKTIKGLDVDRLPFVPRLDIWYQSNKARNSLPEGFKDAKLEDITKAMDLGTHKVIPDFRAFNSRESIAWVGLGIYDLKTNPYRIIPESIDHSFNTDSEGITTTVFNTPFKEISTKTIYNKKMSREGSSIGHTLEHAIKDITDIRALGYIFENIELEENARGFNQLAGSIGQDGLHVGFCSLSASPMHQIMKELCQFERFVYILNDEPLELERLCEKIDLYLDKIIEISCKSTADALMLGANYDSFLTWPDFFHRYITPYLKKHSEPIHKAGKFLITHTDGENKGLLDEYLESNIDLADSICPYPMTSLRLKEIREIFGNKVSIWGGLPSIMVLGESVSKESFDRFVDGFFSDLGAGRNIILSFADTTPPDAIFERIVRIAEIAKDFKPANVFK